LERRDAPRSASGPIPCKILGRRGFAGSGAARRQKTSLFSMTVCLALQIFPNLFLAETGDVNDLRLKKFGFVVFLGFGDFPSGCGPID
jgi:hypothetical protein